MQFSIYVLNFDVVLHFTSCCALIHLIRQLLMSGINASLKPGIALLLL